MSRPSSLRCTARACRARSSGVVGSHLGTGVGRPPASRATNTIRQLVVSSYSPCRGSREQTLTAICMLVRPVWIGRAADLDDIADGDGFVERDAADGDGDAGESAPAGRARARAFVHPLHHGTAVNVPVHVPVFRAGKEAHRELAISSWHGILLRDTPQACQMGGRRSREHGLCGLHVAAEGFVGLAFGGLCHVRLLFTHASAKQADAQLIVLEDAEMAGNGRCGLSVTEGQQSSCRLQYRIHPLFLDQVGRVEQGCLDVVRFQTGVVLEQFTLGHTGCHRGHDLRHADAYAADQRVCPPAPPGWPV